MALILLTVPQQVTNKNKMTAVVSAANSQGFHLREVIYLSTKLEEQVMMV